ncbi:MAG: alpha-glucosidase [SAR324 cluster bacterium]|nr:alpha-glucosidase [SAR324 cluster bacterium]
MPAIKSFFKLIAIIMLLWSTTACDFEQKTAKIDTSQTPDAIQTDSMSKTAEPSGPVELSDKYSGKYSIAFHFQGRVTAIVDLIIELGAFEGIIQDTQGQVVKARGFVLDDGKMQFSELKLLNDTNAPVTGEGQIAENGSVTGSFTINGYNGTFDGFRYSDQKTSVYNGRYQVEFKKAGDIVATGTIDITDEGIAGTLKDKDQYTVRIVGRVNENGKIVLNTASFSSGILMTITGNVQNGNIEGTLYTQEGSVGELKGASVQASETGTADYLSTTTSTLIQSSTASDSSTKLLALPRDFLLQTPPDLPVSIDGLGSAPDGSGVDFKWAIIEKPEQSDPVLTGTKTSQPSFFSNKPGVYKVEMTVSNSQDTGKAIITIIVLEKPGSNKMSTTSSNSQKSALVLDANSYAVGDFVITWNPSLNMAFVIRHQQAPEKILFSADPLKFLAIGKSSLNAHEKRGSFTIEENIQMTCKSPAIEKIVTDGVDLVLSGRFRDDVEACHQTFKVRFKQIQPGHLQFAVTPENKDFNYIELNYDSNPAEKFYGFGEQFTYLNLKGQNVPILSQEGGVGRGRTEISNLINIASPGAGGNTFTTYYGVPQYITSQNRSVLLENTEYVVFNLENPAQVRIRLFANQMTGQVLYGDSMLKLIERTTEYTGRFPVPPEWVNNGAIVGIQGGTDFARKILNDLKQNDTPVAGFWVQDWVGKRKTIAGSQLWWNWEVSESRYPGWKQLVDDLNRENIQVLGYINTFLVDATTREGGVKRNLYQEAKDNDYLVHNESGDVLAVTNTDFDAAMVDLTNPEARQWLKEVIKTEMLDKGLRGWMADFSEALPFEAELHSGESAASYHNRYPMEFAQLNREAIREAGLENQVLYFNRSGYTRSPQFGSMFWEGDQMVTWDGQDGLISSVKGLLSGGFSGITLNHSDIGGYTSLAAQAPIIGWQGFRREKDLLLRWIETNAFTSVFRTHEGNQPEANAQFYSDKDSYQHFSRFAKVYKALGFYRKQLFEEAAAKGYPVVRHPLLHYPDDPVFADMKDATIQFMLGSELMIAPVVQKYTSTRDVYLPKGLWVNLWDQQTYGNPYEGIWLRNVPAPLGKPPVFYPAESTIGPQIVAALRAEKILGPDTPVELSEVDERGFRINGQYKILRGGTLQWFRIPEEAWEDRIKRFKAMGMNTIDMYVSWNFSEPQEGVFNFDNPGITRFLELVKKHGLYVYFRPGPYITNEIDGGGVPAWLLTKTTKKDIREDGKPNLRTQDPDYLDYVEKYYDRLNSVIKPYLISNGGPIILYAIENEYNWFKIFSEVDKAFMYEGGPERGLFQNIDVTAYFSSLRDMLRADGIDVPITTCPGDGKLSNMGDTPDVVPMPNVYDGLGGELPEAIGYNLLTDMHDSSKHNGVYLNMPTGTTETDRDPVKLKRLLVGGLDGIFAFNVMGYLTPGYQNATVLSSKSADAIFSVNQQNVANLFVEPKVGYFHNVVDFFGMVSPSGLHRDSFYAMRRDNMFFDTVEAIWAKSIIPNRSGQVKNADSRLSLSNTELGARENQDRIHYWIEPEPGIQFISLINQSGTSQVINKNGITLNGFQFPRFTELTIPLQRYDSDGQFSQASTDNIVVLVNGYPVPEIGQIDYTTSDMLTLRPFNDGTLLVLYGENGLTGELSLNELNSVWDVKYRDSGITLNENTADRITLSYVYTPNQFLVLQDASGKKLKIMITTKDEAGRVWFEKWNNQDMMLTGVDYVDPNSIQSSSDQWNVIIDHDTKNRPFMVMASGPLVLREGINTLQPYNPETNTVVYQKPVKVELPQLPQTLTSGKSTSDLDESLPDYDDSSWTHWEGEPKFLEENGILRGHAWYRVEVDLDHIPGRTFLKPLGNSGLFIRHASDIVGIYVNGHYVSTMVPLGTELHSTSANGSYKFPEIAPWLKIGNNVLAFRTEIWGHGSFMWPRGTLSATQLRMPALGFDSMKGLSGTAEIGRVGDMIPGIYLRNWSVRGDLGGEQKGFNQPGLDDSRWAGTSIPLKLNKGDVRWYRTRFDNAGFPDPSRIHVPVALELKGHNAKATIFLNGLLIGRWLSDDQWLSRGFYGKGIRDMWMNTEPDHFPVPIESIKPEGNVLSVVFEDTSHSSDAEGGKIDSIKWVYARENKITQNDGSSVKVTAEKGRQSLTFIQNAR